MIDGVGGVGRRVRRRRLLRWVTDASTTARTLKVWRMRKQTIMVDEIMVEFDENVEIDENLEIDEGWKQVERFGGERIWKEELEKGWDMKSLEEAVSHLFIY